MFQLLNVARSSHSTPLLAGPVRRPMPRPLAQTRNFVDHAVFNVLRQSKLCSIAAGKFSIQGFAQCSSHSAYMQKEVMRTLVDEGLVRKQAPKPVERPRRKWSFVPFREDYPDDGIRGNAEPSLANILALNRQHGPVVLRMQALLQPNQGADRYLNFHCALMLAFFEHGGKPVGLLLDGNDLQQNAAMSAIGDYMRRRADTRELSELTHFDFEQTTSDMSARGDPMLDARQLGFRLVDLEQLLLASERKLDWMQRAGPNLIVGPPVPNGILYDAQASVVEPLLPLDVQQELVVLLKENPATVERFQ